MLEFDARTTELLNIAYSGADITRRRQASFDALQPAPGDVIADIGCGNGLLTAELARAVGPDGGVLGIDISEDMMTAAKARCSDFPQVTFLNGSAESLPLDDASVDKAVSVQVFEYLSNITTAVAEAARVLRPGGRLVIGDIHFDSWLWHSDNPERMQRMMAAWDKHLVERCVPALLPPMFRDAGLVYERTTSETILDTVLKPDGLANMMMILIRAYVVGNDLIPEAEAQAWFDEQEQMARDGRFFFSLTHFVTVGRKPD